MSPACRELVPGITHVDGTARLQTVGVQDAPNFHAVIAAFHDLTGVPLVLNTSFNDAGGSRSSRLPGTPCAPSRKGPRPSGASCTERQPVSYPGRSDSGE